MKETSLFKMAEIEMNMLNKIIKNISDEYEINLMTYNFIK